MSDIWEVAKNMELEGKAFYEKLAGESTSPAIAGVFNLLVQEEQRHYELFDDLQKGLSGGKLEYTLTIDEVKAAFSKLTESFKGEDIDSDVESAYKKALDSENSAVQYYTEMLEKTESDGARTAIEFIIKQEEWHAKLMESLMEFAREPKQWLEDAEWSHLGDEY